MTGRPLHPSQISADWARVVDWEYDPVGPFKVQWIPSEGLSSSIEAARYEWLGDAVEAFVSANLPIRHGWFGTLVDARGRGVLHWSCLDGPAICDGDGFWLGVGVCFDVIDELATAGRLDVEPLRSLEWRLIARRYCE